MTETIRANDSIPVTRVLQEQQLNSIKAFLWWASDKTDSDIYALLKPNYIAKDVESNNKLDMHKIQQFYLDQAREQNKIWIHKTWIAVWMKQWEDWISWELLRLFNMENDEIVEALV